VKRRAMMKGNLDWTINIEERTERCYRKAATLFSEEKELSEFLGCLAETEKYHFKIIREAARCIREKKATPSFIISFEEETRQKFELPLIEFEKDLDERRLTKKSLLDRIVSIEFSEWNEIFLYIIDTFKDCCDFSRLGPEIQRRKMYIEKFLESDPALTGLLERLKELPPILQEWILVVTDSEMTTALFAAIFKDEGTVERAGNAEEALEMLSGKYFAAVIINMEMPVMDGIEFYNRVAKGYPHINERILFCTDNDDREYLNFFRENKLRFLITPAPIKKLRNAVVDILHRP
jgi:CheY-like chemotaxis protein